MKAQSDGRSRRSFFKHQQRMAYIFIAAPMLLFFIFTLIPTISNIFISFTDYSVIGETKFTGLDNYFKLFGDTLFWKYLFNTFKYAILYVPISFLVSLFSAIALNKRFRGVSSFRVMFYLPVLSSPVATASIWLWLLNSQKGVINTMLRSVGLPAPSWLHDSHYAIYAIILMSVWASFGSNMMIFLAGLQGVPEHLYESARLDGANKFQELIYVTLPGIGPTIFFVTTNLLIGAMQMFDQAYNLTQGGPGGSTKTLVYYIYESGFTNLRMGYGAAMSMILFLIIMFFSIFNIKFNNSSGDLI